MNIIKMILAWIVAMFFAFTMTGCGKVEDDSGKDSESKSAVADSDNSADDKGGDDSGEDDKTEGESSSEEEKKPETDNESKLTANAHNGRVSTDKLIVEDTYLSDESTRPDDDTLAFFADLAIWQYEVCRDQDKQGYLDSLCFNGLMNTKSAELFCTFLEQYDDEPDLGEAESTALWYNILYLSWLFDDDTALTDGLNTAIDSGRTIEFLRNYTADLTVDNAAGLFDISEFLYGSIYDTEFPSSDDSFYADPSAYTIEDPIVYMDIDVCDVTDHGTFIEFDMEIIDGEHCYEFNEVVAWKTPEAAGVIVPSVRCRPNEYGVYTMEDVLALMEEGQAIDDARANAKIIYNAAAEYIYDSIDLQEIHLDYDELFASRDFDEATSKKGLDISGSRPKSKGDAFLYDAAKESGINSGFIYIGRDKKIDQDFNIFIQWKESKDSTLIGQYPCYFDYSEADIKWGSYYYSKRDGV